MEKKVLNTREIGQIKRIAQNVLDLVSKQNTIQKKIDELQEKIADYQGEIEMMEAPVVHKTGYKSTDLVERVSIPQFNEDGSPKMDKDNKYQQKITKYVLKYPDTIFPPVSEGSDLDIDAGVDAQVLANSVDAVKEIKTPQF